MRPSAALRAAARSLPAASSARKIAQARLGSDSAPVVALRFIRWAEELAGARLEPAHRRLLEEAQARLVLWGCVHDRVADGDEGGLDDFADLLPLQSEAQLRLAAVFGARHPFWSHWRRLVREQVATDRWERERRAPGRFDDAFVRRLAHKATLWRWPAAAVCRLVGQPKAIPRIEAAFDDAFAVLQLFDDLADAEDDAARGQPNAVLAAGAAAHSADVHARIAKGVGPVLRAACERLRRLSQLPGGIGAFARTLLPGTLDERRHAEAATARAVVSILDRVLDGVAGP